MVQVLPPTAVFAKQQRRHEQEEFFIWAAAAARGGASFRSADAAQVCSNVGFILVDGVLECSVATAARKIVSERW